MNRFLETQSRLAVLRRYRALDTVSDLVFDRVTRLTAQTLCVPAAVIAFVDDEKRLWVKSTHGLDFQEPERAEVLSDLVTGSPPIMVIPDVRDDDRFSRHPPLVLGDSPVRFFAGAPLTTPEGYRMGALYILDTRPGRDLTRKQAEMLQDLAALAMDELELHSELLRAEEISARFQQIEARFRGFIESAPLGIVGINREGTIELVNSSGATIFGYDCDELIGQKIEVLMPERAREVHREEREHYLSVPRTRPMGMGMELRARRRDGSEFPVEIGLTRLEVAGEVMTFSFITDVSERLRMEERLRQAQKLESIGQLAGGVAHDFNNLLTVILGNSSIALEYLATGSPLREHLVDISDAAEMAAGLTRQLLAFARKRVIRPNWLNFNDCISRTCKVVKGLMGNNVEVKLILGDDAGEVLADPAVIDQVLINLAVNARDAMPGGGRLTIRTGAVELGEESVDLHLTARPGPHILLAVTDTGTGMTPEVQARIFEPFFTTKGPGRGTGLGLASVYGSVKQAGGGIQISSRPNGGSTFEVFLPRIQETHPLEVTHDPAEVPGGVGSAG